jgi:hypothetical protein
MINYGDLSISIINTEIINYAKILVDWKPKYNIDETLNDLLNYWIKIIKSINKYNSYIILTKISYVYVIK